MIKDFTETDTGFVSTNLGCPPNHFGRVARLYAKKLLGKLTNDSPTADLTADDCPYYFLRCRCYGGVRLSSKSLCRVRSV